MQKGASHILQGKYNMMLNLPPNHHQKQLHQNNSKSQKLQHNNQCQNNWPVGRGQDQKTQIPDNTEMKIHPTKKWKDRIRIQKLENLQEMRKG